MQSSTSPTSPLQELSRTIALLNDVHDALEQNSYIEEAQLVSRHLQQLTTTQVESRIKVKGIEPVMAELAQGFSVDSNKAF